MNDPTPKRVYNFKVMNTQAFRPLLMLDVIERSKCGSVLLNAEWLGAFNVFLVVLREFKDVEVY